MTAWVHAVRRLVNYQVVHVLTAFLLYRSFLLKLIYICGHFLTVSNRRYGRCYTIVNSP